VIKDIDKQVAKLDKELIILKIDQQKITAEISKIPTLTINQQQINILQDQRSQLLSQIKTPHQVIVSNNLELDLITVTTNINANQISLNDNKNKYQNLYQTLQKQNKTKLLNLNAKFEANKEKLIASLKAKIEQLYLQLKPLNKSNQRTKQQYTETQNAIQNVDEQIKKLQNIDVLLQSQIAIIQNYEETKNNYTKYLEAEKTLLVMQQKLKTKNKKEINLQSRINSHQNLEYDPNCKYCVINNGINEMKEDCNQLTNIQNRISGINNEIIKITQTLQELSNFKTSHLQNDIQIESNNKLQQQIEKNQYQISLLTKDKSSIESKLSILNAELENEKENIIITLHNTTIQNSIKTINGEIETTSKSQHQNYCNFKILEEELNTLDAIINKLELNLVKDINKQQAIQLEINKIKENEIIMKDNKNITDNIQNIESKLAILYDQQKEFDRKSDLINKSKDLQIQILNLSTKLTKLIRIQKNNQIHKNNKLLNQEIKEIEKDFARTKSVLEKLLVNITKNESDQQIINSEINKYNKLQLTTQELLEKKIIVEKYISIVDKNGLPYTLLSKTTPKIKQEMNKILSTIANFTIDLCLDNDKVEIYKLTNNQKKQSIEGCCGFEKFIIGLAARLTLSKISNVNNNSTLVIDEGLSCLDNENINSLDVLYNYLRNNFKYVILISHIQHIRGSCDKLINITIDPVTKKSCVKF
jgi:DNA repair protein SbcC/Rad50